MATKDYDPYKVAITINGQIVEGYADGTFISVSRNNQTWTVQSGASGEAARSKSNDRTGTVELTLMQTSAFNDVLSGLFFADETGTLNAGKFLFTLTDQNGSTLLGADQMWVQQPPTVEYGKELGDRVWTLETGNLFFYNVGGENDTFDNV
jgi:hypothetical protein